MLAGAQNRMATIKQNFFFNTVLNVSKVIFPLITAPYIARVLAPEGVGIFNFACTYAGYFAMVAALGIPTYGIREVAKCRNDREKLTRLTSELVSISVLTTIAVSILYLLSIAFIQKLSANAIVFLVIGVSLYLTPFSIDWYYSGLEEFRYITARSIIIKALSVAAMFAFVKTRSDLIIYVIINVFSGVLNNIWNYAKLLKSGIKPKFTAHGLKKHWSPILILFASSAAISVYTVLDTLMLGFMTEYSEVAYYSNATNISKMLLAAITSFSAVAIPRISIYLQDNNQEKVNELINKSFSMVSFIAFPAAVGLCCITPTFVPLFYGSQFYGTIIPLQILSFLIVAIGLNNLSGVQILIGYGKDKLFLYSVIIGAIANFSMNLFLIPRYGASGASIASLSAETIILIITMLFAKWYTSAKLTQYLDIIKASAATILFIPLINLLKHCLSGWTLVFVFCVSGFFIYVLAEYILKNSSLDFFFHVVKAFIQKHVKKN